MNLTFRTHGIARTSELSQHVERKIRSALGRFGPRVEVLHVQLTDLNGPKGGVDVECRIRLDAGPIGTLVVREVSETPFRALARAADRVSEKAARRLQRAHDRRSGRMQARRQQSA